MTLLTLLLMATLQSHTGPQSVPLLAGDWKYHEMLANPQGTSVFLMYVDSGTPPKEKLLVIDAAGASTYEVTARPPGGSGAWDYRTAKWSPRGDVLAIEFVTDEVSQVLLLYLADRTVEYLNFDLWNSILPRWSMGGNSIYFLPGAESFDEGFFEYNIETKLVYRILIGATVGDCVPIDDGRVMVLLQGACVTSQNCIKTLDVDSIRGPAVGQWNSKERRLIPLPQAKPK